jgi:hypothetical protein
MAILDKIHDVFSNPTEEELNVRLGSTQRELYKEVSSLLNVLINPKVQHKSLYDNWMFKRKMEEFKKRYKR